MILPTYLMNLRNRAFLLSLVLIFTAFISSCNDSNPYEVDYSLAEEHKYNLSEADSVKTTESGLKIYYIEAGTGIYEVERRDQIRVYYTGRIWPDGEIFDSSYKNRVTTPVTFDNIGNLVQGFKEGIVGMKEGEKRVLIIPPELGYGDNPNSRLSDDTLRFDIELDEIIL